MMEHKNNPKKINKDDKVNEPTNHTAEKQLYLTLTRTSDQERSWAIELKITSHPCKETYLDAKFCRETGHANGLMIMYSIVY